MLPILPAQIPWISMAMGIVLGITLAFEAKEEGIIRRPPRSCKAPLLDNVTITRVVIVGVVLLSGAFGLFEQALRTGRTIDQPRAVAANVIAFAEIAFLFNCRSLQLRSRMPGVVSTSPSFWRSERKRCGRHSGAIG